MPGLDHAIVEHHIGTWLDPILVCQKQRPIHPSKREAIKAETDMLKQVGLFYPIEYTTWVSNPDLILKKQGTIHV